MAPVDPPPAFLDPDRRARLEAAFPAIDAYVQQTVARDGLVGLAAGVVIDGELAWFRGYGHRDPERGLPVERDTVFGIGSITKSFTSLAVLRLRDEGRLDLDLPAATYLPALNAIAYPTADSPRITVRHLFNHTSGLPRMGNFPEYPETPPTRDEFLATLTGLGLDRPPGQRYVYSNLGVQLLGPLIEEVAGVDHRTYVRDAILDPLGLRSTVWFPEDVPGDRLAVGHGRLPGDPPRARPHWRPGAADAAGGLYSSLDDLARYAAYHLAAWPARDEPESGPLRRSTLREAHTLSSFIRFWAEDMGDAPPRAGASGMGLGFSVRTDCRYDHVVGFNGKTLNYRAAMQLAPTRGVAVILMSNLSSISSRVLPADTNKMLDILADTGALEPRKYAATPALLAAAGRLGALIGAWDDAEHASLFSADFRDAYPTVTTATQLDEWRALVGACRDPRPVSLEDPRAGTLELTCDRGLVRVDVRVAPWDGAPITAFQIHSAAGLPPAPALTRAAERVLAVRSRWSEREFRSLFTAAFDAAEMRRSFADSVAQRGRCRLGEPQVLGARKASFALSCERGDAAPTLTVELAKADPSKITSLTLRVQRDGPCR